jgi:phosphoribosylformylglycinamidine synthase
MAMASGLGASLDAAPADTPPHAFWFGEDQARYLVTVRAERTEALLARARDAGVLARALGRVGGVALRLPGERPIAIKALVERFEGWLPAYMAGAA